MHQQSRRTEGAEAVFRHCPSNLKRRILCQN